MADYQRVVEYLRDLRQSSGSAGLQVTDQVVRAAEDFAQLCTSANERLRQCSTFLQQGLRTEAIHLAEQQPNLLDLVAALDLPDPETWSEFCQNNGLAVPPALQMDRATQLNEAYSHGAGMEELLAKHRRLALARGAVRDRLAVLRQIAAADNSGTWEKDVRLFEKTRLKELPSAFHAAMKARDEGKIRELMEEVHGAPWVEAVPADLSSAVAEADARFRRAAAEGQLRELVEPLRDAFAARDAAMCRTLLARWKAVLERTGAADVSSGLVEELKPVAAFVADEEKRDAKRKRFKDACRAFGGLLDRDAPESELEPAWARLKAFDEPVPEELEKRYGEKREARERAAVRAHRMKLATTGGIIAVVAAGVIVAVLLFQQSKAAKEWAGRIEQANKGHDLKGADTLIGQLQQQHSGYMGDASVVAAMRHTRELHDELDREQRSVQQLLGSMAAAEQRAGTANADGQTDDQLAAAHAQLQAVLDQLGAAGDLSWGDAEGKLPAETARVKALSEDTQRKLAAAAQSDIGTLSARLEAIAPGAATSPTARAELAAVTSRLETIRGWRALGPDASAAAAALAEKLAVRQQAFATEKNAAGAIEALRSETGSGIELSRALIAFTKRFPNDGRAGEFAQAAAANAAWGDAAEAWKRVWGATGPVDPATADEADKRAGVVAAYLKDYPGSPLKAALNTYVDYLKRFSAATAAPTNTWDTALNDFFANPLLSQLQYMERSDGRRFYVLGDIKRQNLEIQGQTTVIFQAIDPKNAAKTVPVLVDPPLKLVTETPAEAPHTKLVKTFIAELKSIDASNWESWGIDAAERLREADAIDPVVKGVLLERILKAEVQVAGPDLGDVYGPTLAALARQKSDSVPWLDPAAEPDATKKALLAIVAGMPAGDAVKTTLAQRKADQLRVAAFDVAATGVLLKDGDWTLVSKSTLPDKGVIYTIAAAEGSGSATGAVSATGPAATPGNFVQVGRVAGGKAALDAAALSIIPQGAIAYVLKP